MSDFIHGVETVEVESGPRPVRTVRAGVIGVIGTDPRIGRTAPVLITSPRRASELLAPALPEYTLRKTVDKLFENGAQTIVVVNIFNYNEHTVAVEDEVRTIVNGRFFTATALAYFSGANNITVKSMDENTTYVFNTDYRVNDYGEFTILNTALLANPNTQVKVSYRSHRASLVDPAEVIGGFVANTGVRTGLEVFDLCRTNFGFDPKIILCPTFDYSQTVVDALITKCNKLRARALVDGSMATVSDVLTARGPAGNQNFRTGSKRIGLCWPKRSVTMPYGTDFFGLSVFVAGAWARTIATGTYWKSPSNKEMLGAGTEITPITGAINGDASTESNILNDAGVITHLNHEALKLTWGNRSAAHPSSTAPDVFMSVLLTADIIDESIEMAMRPFIDEEITDALIDSILETVNTFLRTLVGRGAIIPGAEAIYDPADNPDTEIAQGRLTFLNKYLPAPPAERITFKRYLYIESLSNLQQS